MQKKPRGTLIPRGFLHVSFDEPMASAPLSAQLWLDIGITIGLALDQLQNPGGNHTYKGKKLLR